MNAHNPATLVNRVRPLSTRRPPVCTRTRTHGTPPAPATTGHRTSLPGPQRPSLAAWQTTAVFSNAETHYANDSTGGGMQTPQAVTNTRRGLPFSQRDRRVK